MSTSGISIARNSRGWPIGWACACCGAFGEGIDDVEHDAGCPHTLD